MEDVSLIKEIKKAVSTPMMDGAQVGPFVEAFRVYHIDESYNFTESDTKYYNLGC